MTRRSPIRHAGTISRRRSTFDDSALYDGFVSGEYACASKANDLWCGGDDRFGQLGRGSTHGQPRLHLAPLNDLAVGYWHACATGDIQAVSVLRCRGRDDVGDEYMDLKFTKLIPGLKYWLEVDLGGGGPKHMALEAVPWNDIKTI